jgi:SAM-dependent methyltransferase
MLSMRAVQRIKAMVQATARSLGYEIHKIGTVGLERTPGRVSFDRTSIAQLYIAGNGIEIGALYSPLKIPSGATVKYIDRLPLSGLRKEYPELSSKELVNVDIVDDGELLETIDDASQDFVIANHVLEHCQDPIRALRNMFRVLRSNGILYLVIPDKRFTVDVDRPVTPLHHLLDDLEDGGASSRRAAFEEWVRYVKKAKNDAEVEKQANELMRDDYSIHYHAWTQVEMLELVLALKEKIGLEFEVELFHKLVRPYGTEVIVILRKSG